MAGESLFAALVGWFSSGILLLTSSRQVFTQWRSRQTSGVSRWLFQST